MLERWKLLEFTFHDELGVDLEDVWAVKSWRWFRIRVAELLAGDNRLARTFRQE